MVDKHLLINILYRMTQWDEAQAQGSDVSLAVEYWKRHIRLRKEPEVEQKIYQLFIKSLEDENYDYKSITPIFKLSNRQISDYLKRIEPAITAYVKGPEPLCDKTERAHSSLFEPSDKDLFPWFVKGWIITTEQLSEKYGPLVNDVIASIDAMQNNTASVKQLKLIANICDRNKHCFSMLPFTISERELKNVPFAREKRFRRIKRIALNMIDLQKPIG